jgi:hypothetical protein
MAGTEARGLTATRFPLFLPTSLLAIRRAMTDRIALGLAGLVCAALALDWAMGWGVSLYLARKFLDLIHLVAIWR